MNKSLFSSSYTHTHTHNTHTNVNINIRDFTRLLLGRLAFVPDRVSINGRFKDERPPNLAGPPSGGRAAFMTPMHPLYSTRPYGLLQAIFWHTCPNLDLGP